MKVHSFAEAEIHAPVGHVYKLATDKDAVADYFKGYGLIPSTQKVEFIDSETLKIGMVRRIFNSDGSVIDEKICELVPNQKQSYELIRGFQPPFSWLVKKGRADWTFQEKEGKTLLRWDFSFELTTFIVWPVAKCIMKFFFQKAQELTLQNMKKKAETAPFLKNQKMSGSELQSE